MTAGYKVISKTAGYVYTTKQNTCKNEIIKNGKYYQIL